MKLIAITGGPCAGKTSAMDVLRERFDQSDMRAIFVPEAATDLITAGIAPWTCASMLEFQTRVIALQLQREAAAVATAAATGAAAIVCDRGICDSHAYLSDDDYQAALAANGLTADGALARYDAVFHLESVATDNPQAYTKTNNSARFESAEEAAAVDERVISAWSAHRAFSIIENRERFEEKAATLCRAVIELAGKSGPSDSPHAQDGDAPILVSACLLGEPCRYDGKAQPCQAIIDLARAHELVPVCPEQLGGLPTPRTPSEVQPDGRVLDSEGVDRTAAFEAGAREALRIAQERGCSRAILKENSPSCGSRRVYDGTFTGTLVPGMGKTAALLAENGIEATSEADYR